MTQLKCGSKAPNWSSVDVFGRPVQLDDYRGQSLLFSFYRYASCPLCNLRVHELLRHYTKWKASGLEMVAVFESPAEHIQRYLDRHDVPFPIIPDPQRQLYRAYGVEPSWGAFFRAWTRHLPMVFEAVVRKRYFPGRMDGDWAMVPADFLIGPDLRVVDAFYGNHIGDHMPMDRIAHFLREGNSNTAASNKLDITFHKEN
ncbi:MAG: redoxin domain-containing protein [Gammaproteobacteria bacterium]|nr:redoxin domain-containing protein [Gammaproteobacteria bacterium]